LSIPDQKDLTQGGRTGIQTARILRFPIHTVCVRPRGDGGWFVHWRTWAWLHGSRADALTDAHAIAATHGVRVVEQ
jgi:hypothetical protein